MNTIDDLKKLAGIIEKLRNDKKAIELQIADCYMPFKEIIKEVIKEVLLNVDGYLYIDDIDIVNENLCFALRYCYDDECEGTYSFPIESFVSADTLRKHIWNESSKRNLKRLKKKFGDLKDD